MIKYLSQISKFVFFFVTLLTSVILLFQTIDYQPLLSQGDHGRDLYAFQATAQGATPYKDYWWVYGPLMPYYYGLFLKTLGCNIQTILFAKMLLVITAGIFVYLALSILISPGLSFMGTVWFYFYSQDFFYTYNHAGGLAVLIAIIYFTFLYIRNQLEKYLFSALALAFILGFIKINIGFCALVCLALITYIVDRASKIKFGRNKAIFYCLALLIAPAITIAAYFELLFKLPIYTIRQCLPYLSSDHPIYMSAFDAIQYFIIRNYQEFTKGGFFFLLVLFLLFALFIYFIILIKKNKLSIKLKRQIILSLLSLAIFYGFYLHEYLASGFYYRSFWSEPFQILFMFIILGACYNFLPAVINGGIFFLFFCFLTINSVRHFDTMKTRKIPAQYLNLERGKVFLGNERKWIEVVENTTYFLHNQLKDTELFFALPNDALYYYLTGKKSPTRQLIFFNHINIPQEQEAEIIYELEFKKVNWILLSNRSRTQEVSFGTLGQSYCPILAKYIFDNFKPVAQFGEWDNPSGWATSHAVRILKRIHAP